MGTTKGIIVGEFKKMDPNQYDEELKIIAEDGYGLIFCEASDGTFALVSDYEKNPRLKNLKRRG